MTVVENQHMLLSYYTNEALFRQAVSDQGHVLSGIYCMKKTLSGEGCVWTGLSPARAISRRGLCLGRAVPARSFNRPVTYPHYQ